MPYNVPNGPDAPNIDLTEPDNADYYALGFHRTGVISGGTVTQPGGPSMTVQVAAAEIVIDGVPITKTLGPVTLDGGGSNPRFDIIGWNVAGGPVAIKGTLSNNPSLPTFDQALFCMAAIVYIGAGVSSVTSPYIVQKQVTPTVSLRRNYANDTDVVLDWAVPTKVSAFKALANGTMSWANSLLTRTADAALSWATSLTILQNVATDRALTLKAAANPVKGNNILEVQAIGSTAPIAGIDSTGRLAGLNFRSGNGVPEGAITADRGTLYLNEGATSGDTALYAKTTDGVATGWVALAQFVPSSQAIPVGSILPWPGTIGTNAIPVGYLACDGTEQSTAAYVNLSAFCSTKFGSAAAGNFKLPDYRGKTLFGVDGTLATGVGQSIGAATVTLDITQMPIHDHILRENYSGGQVGHDHPRAGQYPYVVPQAMLPPYNLPKNNGTGAGVDLEPTGFNHATVTQMKADTTGGGLPFSTFQPSQSVNWLIKT